MRFVFCAAAICRMLGRVEDLDRPAIEAFISSCRRYDGGYALVPGQEAHGGATYCAVAALTLIGAPIPEPELLARWCLFQQSQGDGGLSGRCNKVSDTCYSFWIGGTLQMLPVELNVNAARLEEYLLHPETGTQDRRIGGFRKTPEESFADLLHSYFGVCGLALVEHSGVKPLDASLGVASEQVARFFSLDSK